MKRSRGLLPLFLISLSPALATAAAGGPRLGLVVEGDRDVPASLVADARTRLSAAFGEVTSSLVPPATVDRWLADARTRAGSSCAAGLVSRGCRVSLGYVIDATSLAFARLTRTGGRCILSVRVFELTRDQPVASYAGQGPCDAPGLMALARKSVARVGPVLHLPRLQLEKRPGVASARTRAGATEAPEEPDDESEEDEGSPAETTPAEGAPPELAPEGAPPPGGPPPDGA